MHQTTGGALQRTVVLTIASTVYCAVALAQGTAGGGGSTGSGGSGALSRANATGATVSANSPLDGGSPAAVDSRTPPGMMYLTGRVMMEDGTAPGELVTLDVICRGRARSYGVTDSTGSFTLNLGRPDAYAMGDAGATYSSRPSGDSAGGFAQLQMRDLVGCDLRARMPGFLSQSLPLTDQRSTDSTDVGTLVMHSLGAISGLTVSMVSANAPADAKRALQKGLDAAKKREWSEAERHLRKAIELYSKYSEAWEAMGRLHEIQHDFVQAKADYSQSVTLDPKFVTPHLRLLVMAGSQQEWSAVARYAAEVVELDPFSYPIAFYLRAVACLNLSQKAEAEDAARHGLRIDSQARMPRLNQILGSLLMEKGAYTEAIPYLKAYLALRPGADDAGQMHRMIADSERQMARQSALPPAVGPH